MNPDIKNLVLKTGLPVSKCKEAYNMFNNFDEALSYLHLKWGGVWSTADH